SGRQVPVRRLAQRECHGGWPRTALACRPDGGAGGEDRSAVVVTAGPGRAGRVAALTTVGLRGRRGVRVGWLRPNRVGRKGNDVDSWGAGGWRGPSGGRRTRGSRRVWGVPGLAAAGAVGCP